MSVPNASSHSSIPPVSAQLSSAIRATQIRSLSSALHTVVSSVVAARQMATGQQGGVMKQESVLLQLARSYRSLLCSESQAASSISSPISNHSKIDEQKETIKDLLLQLFKCLLPYMPSADGVHEILKMMEGIGGPPTESTPKISTSTVRRNNSASSASPTATASTPASSTSAHQWPFALCGMLIDACASSPSIPYILFDGDAPSTLVMTSLTPQIWPPGLTLTSMGTASPVVNSPTIGYSYGVWIYMEPVVDAAALDSSDPASPSFSSSSPIRGRSSSNAPMLGEIGKASSSRQACSRFVLLSLSSEDGKTGLNLTYQADTGTLTLRTGVSAAPTPPASSFSFRFTPAVNTGVYEFQNVGLIPHRWCHIVLTHTRGTLQQSSKATEKEKDNFQHPTAQLYVDGTCVSSTRVGYLTRASTAQQGFKAWMGSAPVDAPQSMMDAGEVIGLRWRWRVASTLLMDEVLTDETIKSLYDAGPRMAALVPSNMTDREGVPMTVTPSTHPLARIPVVDATSAWYDLPSACAEALDDLAAQVTRHRRTGTFASVGTVAVHVSTGKGFQPSPSNNGRPTITSPSSLHEHLLAPALSSEQELLTQRDMTPLENNTMALNQFLVPERILWFYHARLSDDMSKEQQIAFMTPFTPSGSPIASSSSSKHRATPSSGSITFPHSILYNTGGGATNNGDGRLYGAQCLILQPQPPQDVLRHIGGLKRILVLIEQCCMKPFLSTTVYSDEFNPSTQLRQVMLLLLMCLRRHPKNFREMHLLDGYRLLGYFLRHVSGKKFRVAVTAPFQSPSQPPTSPITATNLAKPTAESFSSPPPKYRRGSIFQTRQILDAHIVDLIFGLVGLSDRCMGGYIANLLALEFLLLDYRMWERTGLEVQLYVFQGLINACVGNPDRDANIHALREARFIPWLLVILTNSKAFGASSSSPDIRRNSIVGAGKHGPLSVNHQELSLLNNILTLLRILLMSELIDQELHLLANFAMTRMVSATPSPKNGHATNTSCTLPIPIQPISPNRLATAQRIQKDFIEMLLDVLLKVSNSSNGGMKDIHSNHALAIFTKSINFHWIFGVLKGDKAMMKVTDRIWKQNQQDDSQINNGHNNSTNKTSHIHVVVHDPQPPSPDCALLTMKILLVLLDSPQLLQEFRSSAMQNNQPAATAAAAPSANTSAPARAQAALNRIVSFASLSNLLLPYATCPKVYPILFCMLFGKNIHHLNLMPAELSTATIDELFRTVQMNADGSTGQVTLVVPEVIDILIDLLSRCLHILADEQQLAYESNPNGFFSAAAAVASFIPPVTPHPKVYKTIYETGIIAPPPSKEESKFGIDHSKWNEERADQLESVSHPFAVRSIVQEMSGTIQVTPIQSLHDPPEPASNRPNPLFLSPTSSTPNSSSGRISPPPSASQHPSSTTLNISLLNGLILFFMRLLHISDDFGRIVARSTFLRPFVAGLFASAHLNPILALAAQSWPKPTTARPHHVRRPSSAQAITRFSDSNNGMNDKLSPAGTAQPPTRPHSSAEVRPSTNEPFQVVNNLLSPEPNILSPDSAANFSEMSASPESITNNPLGSPENPPLGTPLFSPEAGSASPPAIHSRGTHLPSMDLLSPPGTVTHAADSNDLASPQFISFQQAHLSQLVAPPSPTLTPANSRRSPPSPSTLSTTEEALQLTIDAVSPPSVVQQQLLFQDQLTARSAGGMPISSSTESAADSSFTFTPSHTPLSPESNAAASPTHTSSSIRLPIFRHSTSQLMLRFLRQIIMYHLNYKKDGWMILQKVLDSFPSQIQPSIFLPTNTTEKADESDTKPSRMGVENYQKHEELIKGFQSAVLSILLIRIQERLASNESRTNPFLASLINATMGAQPQLHPSKYLTNLAHVGEFIFLKIQTGMFVTQNFTLGNATGWNVSTGQTLSGAMKNSNAGSTIGLLTTLVGILNHEGLRTTVDELANTSVAFYARAGSRRKSSTISSTLSSATNSGSSLAGLTATLGSPLNKAVRSLQDIVMNCVLHLYDQFTMKELSMRELIQVNQFIITNRRIVLGEYLLSAHTSSYISSTNVVGSGGNAPPTTASPASAASFSSRSFIACMLYHLYNFQLNAMTQDEQEQFRKDSMHSGLEVKHCLPVSPANSHLIEKLRMSALPILVVLIRSKPAILSELMKVSISEPSAAGADSPKANRRSSMSFLSPSPPPPESTSTSVPYDLFNNGFDVLLNGFNLPSLNRSPPNSRRSTSNASPNGRSAEIDGFFDWLSIQRSIIETVFSRTIQPEWKNYCKFLNGFLYAANEANLVHVGRMAERDHENATIDHDEILWLHVCLEQILADATQIDANRYVHRLQALYEQDSTMKKIWKEMKEDITRLYAMYSSSRLLYPNMPRKSDWKQLLKNHPRSSPNPLSNTPRSPFIQSSPNTSSGADDTEQDGELLISPSELVWQQPWKLDPTECISRLRVRLVRAQLDHPSKPLFNFPYKREADDLRETQLMQEAFQLQQFAAKETAKREEAERRFSAKIDVDGDSDEKDTSAEPEVSPTPTTTASTEPLSTNSEEAPKATLSTTFSPKTVVGERRSSTLSLITETNDTTSESQPTSNSTSPSSAAVAVLASSDEKSKKSDLITPIRQPRRHASSVFVPRTSPRASEVIDQSSFSNDDLSVKMDRLIDLALAGSPTAGSTTATTETGKLVPESSDRPAPLLRRVQSLAMTPHTISSLAQASPVGTDRKPRRGSFFGGATRNVLSSPRIGAQLSPIGGGGGTNTSNPTTPVVPVFPVLGLPAIESSPKLFSQTSFRRRVSFDKNEETTTETTAESNPTSLTTDPAASEAIPTMSLTLSTTASSMEAVPTAAAQNSTPIASSFAMSSMDTSVNISRPGSSASQLLTDQVMEEEEAYFASLLTQEDQECFLYEERLRLLLDGESINFHYNCLRIQGLEEISAIFLLCTHSLFIVDQYQVNPDGSIVRLESAHTKDHKKSDSASSQTSDETIITTSRRWSYTDIISVHKRRYLLRPAALELFFSDHSTYLLVVNIKQRELIYKNLMTLCPNITDGYSGSFSAVGGTLVPGSVLPAPSAASDLLNSPPQHVLNSPSVAGTREGGFRDGLQIVLPPPNIGGAANPIGLGVGVGGLTAPNTDPTPSTDTAASTTFVGGVNRLSSIFFANHTLATEGAINQLSSIVAAALETFTVEWQHGFLSNFDYLMLLNSFSGRSFNDLTQYPVFPWVLSDYDSPALDLHDPRSFRDLSKPMGALDELRASQHRQKYKETDSIWREEERENATSERGPRQHTFIAPGVSRAYNYGTHYSSAAVVMYYLARIEPYSQYLISFQSGRFDRADRLFSSIKQTFLTASKLPSGDVKELIPEFYYLAPLLTNGNALDFGHRQDGRQVNHVLLPPWCKGSPKEFIRLHRLALESEHVSAHLHEWIDLIFGMKQTGELARNALNVFHYVTYAGNVDIDKITDPVLRRGMIEQIRSFGQTPATLFTKTHPPRLVQPQLGKIFHEPHSLQPTDTTKFSHPIAQIFCMERSMLLSGVLSSPASAVERLLIAKPNQLLTIPTLQQVSSFLPYSEQVNPACVSTRNARLSKSYRSSPMFNKLSYLQWALVDGSLRAGLIDLGAFSSGGLEHAISLSTTIPSGPSVRTLKSYLNMHDGCVRVACVPLEGDDGTLVTGGRDCLVCVWHRTDSSSSSAGEESYCLAAELSGHRAPITAVMASQSYSIIVSGSDDGTVIMWDLMRLQPIRTLRLMPNGSSIKHLAINLATGDLTIAAANPSSIMVVDVNGSLLAQYPDPRAIEQSTVPTALRRDISMDEVTSLVSLPTVGHRESLHLSSPWFDTGGLILTGHSSGAIRIWHLRWLSFSELFESIENRAHETNAFKLSSQVSQSAPPINITRSLSFRTPPPNLLVRTQTAGTPYSEASPSPSQSVESISETNTGGHLSFPIRARGHSAAEPTTTASSHSFSASSPSSSPGPVSSIQPQSTEIGCDTPIDTSATSSPIDPTIAAATTQQTARLMSGLLFGSPGEEQIADEYFKNGLEAKARLLPSTPNCNSNNTNSTSLTSPPLEHRQWHLVCVNELLGHQVPVTALSFTRDRSSLYSGDANGNIVHFTFALDDTTQNKYFCACKSSQNKSRMKQYQTLLTGSSSTHPPAPDRIQCGFRDCTYVGCQFCQLEHIRKAHTYIITASVPPPTPIIKIRSESSAS